MKVLTILVLTLTTSHALVRGKDYMKEKVCQEFNAQGKENFRAGVIFSSSQKYSNATFEEVRNIVDDILSIAEQCCPEGAAPDCYENASIALAEKSCSNPAHYPKHSGIEACCAEQGLERKLCLAALKHPPKEFPTYVEPSDTEVCEAFAKDPRDFADRYLYEYSTDNSNAPLPLLAAAARSYLSMVAKCCTTTSVRRVSCFLKERLSRKSAATLALVSHKACSHYEFSGKDRIELSYIIRFAQKSTNVSFEDASFLAQDASEMLSRTCNSMAEDGFERELREHTTKICNKLSGKDLRFEECCSGADQVTNYFCLYSLPRVKPPNLPDFPKPTNEELCGRTRKQLREHYAFELARRYTRIPEGLLTFFYFSTDPVVDSCCNETDPNACLDVKRPPVREQLRSLLSQGNELCVDYTDLPFLEFKKRLRETYQKALPEATEDVLSDLVEQRVSLASTCCLLNAPPKYCGLKVKTDVGHTCSHGICVLHRG